MRAAEDMWRAMEEAYVHQWTAIDVDENEEIAAEYHVNSMPTFVFVKNSKKLEEFSGANVDKLKNTILKLK
ncbi:hypothetical protein MSG28_015755 [Choristoneura fumiferana]|uniref:Uncharacterized protein n=1 Tax=Choristoneura fumiferana TaxID=7141 RepID=A0ACC0KBR5_CHOFU|nr:hypothetical protein MSG28_015755 [Choristoneura fumiferana]